MTKKKVSKKGTETRQLINLALEKQKFFYTREEKLHRIKNYGMFVFILDIVVLTSIFLISSIHDIWITKALGLSIGVAGPEPVFLDIMALALFIAGLEISFIYILIEEPQNNWKECKLIGILLAFALQWAALIASAIINLLIYAIKEMIKQLLLVQPVVWYWFLFTIAIIGLFFLLNRYIARKVRA